MVAHKKSKKKSKKQHGSAGEKELHESKIHAEIIDDEAEYPTSRVIKRAPNGDVIVESLPEEESLDRSELNQDHRSGSSSSSTNSGGVTNTADCNADADNEEVEDTKWPIKLDTHWESLSLEERRNILRISKDELFDMIKSYKNMHNCDCSMCGRHNNLNIEQEIEQIYCELYDSAREEDSDTDFVQFHLKLIKEYQNGSNNTHHHMRHHGDKQDSNICHENFAHNDNDDNNDSTNKNAFLSSILPKEKNASTSENECTNDFLDSLSEDSAIKYCLSEGAIGLDKSYQVDFLGKEEVDSNMDTIPNSDNKTQTALDWKHEIEQFKSSKQKQVSESTTGKEALPPINDIDNTNEVIPEHDEFDSKLLHFAKTVVSSHPHIAEEFINRAMMYPHIKAITEDMMNNEGEGLKRAMESLVLQQELQDWRENMAVSIEKKIYEMDPTEPVIDVSESDSNENERVNGPANALEENNKKDVIESDSLDRPSLVDNNKVDSLIDSIPFKFVKDPKAVASLKNAFYDIFTNKTRRSEIDQDDKEYKEELERLRNEISADEDQASYEWSNDEYEESNDHDEDAEGYVDDECIDDHHLDSGYDDENEDEDIIYDDLHENVKLNEDPSAVPNGHTQLIHHDNSVTSNVSEDGIDDNYDSELDHAERLEEGRRLIQIAITKLLQKKLIASYQEKEAEKNRERLLMELEAEENQKKEKEKKKLKKKEKEKEKKRQQQLAKEEEKKRQEEEEIRLKKEAEEKEIARREAQRKKVEEAKRKNDEKRKKKLAEQRRREEEQERIRKEKEEQKRQREEEQKQKKMEKERKQREFEEQRLLKKKEAEQLQKLKENQKLNEKSMQKNQDTTTEGVPYGSVSTNPLQNNSTLNDDIFNMINEVSKSLSSSPSRNQNDLLGSSVLSNVDHQGGLNAGNVFIPPSLSMSEMSPHAQAGFNTLGSSLQPNLLNGWDQQSSTQAYYHANQPSSSEAPGLLPLSHGGSSSKFSSFADTTVDVTDDVNNLTSFLKDTTINDISLGSTSSIPAQNLDPVNMAPRPQSAVYNQPNLWNNDPNQRLSNFGQQHVQQNPISSSHSQPRRSIWDTGAENTFGVASANNFASNIWDTPTSTPALPNTLLSSQVAATSVDSYEEVLAKTYKMLSPDNSFVPLDKLYQTSLTQINAKSVLSYPQFISTLVSMKNSYNTELLNDNTGLLAYCRMGSVPVPSGLPSYNRQNTFPHATTQVQSDSQQINSVSTPISNPLPQPSSVFNDVHYNQTATTSPANHGNPIPGPTSTIASDPSNFVNFGQSYPNSYQTGNIWS